MMAAVEVAMLETRRRSLVGSAAACAAGWAALTVPVVLEQPQPAALPSLLPLLRDAVASVRPASLAILFSVGVGLGRVVAGSPRLLGFAMVAALAVWSRADFLASGGTELQPVRWLVLGASGLVAGWGVLAGRRFRGSGPSVKGGAG
jgi:hypothetical protein